MTIFTIQARPLNQLLQHKEKQCVLELQGQGKVYPLMYTSVLCFCSSRSIAFCNLLNPGNIYFTMNIHFCWIIVIRFKVSRTLCN